MKNIIYVLIILFYIVAGLFNLFGKNKAEMPEKGEMWRWKHGTISHDPFNPQNEEIFDYKIVDIKEANDGELWIRIYNKQYGDKTMPMKRFLEDYYFIGENK